MKLKMLVKFTEDAIESIASMAFFMNQTKENIGARRLHTILEQVMEDISFSADELKGQEVVIDAEYVRSKLHDTIKENDLRKYIL